MIDHSLLVLDAVATRRDARDLETGEEVLHSLSCGSSISVVVTKNNLQLSYSVTAASGLGDLTAPAPSSAAHHQCGRRRFRGKEEGGF